MTKTEEIDTKAKIIVDGIAFTKNDNQYVLTELGEDAYVTID